MKKELKEHQIKPNTRERTGTGQLTDYGRHMRNAKRLAWAAAGTMTIVAILQFTAYSNGWFWWIPAFVSLAWVVAAGFSKATCVVCGCGDHETCSEKVDERQQEEREYHSDYEVISTIHDTRGNKIGENRRNTGYWTSTRWKEIALKYTHKCKQCGHTWDGGTKWRRKTDSEQQQEEAKAERVEQEQRLIRILKTRRNFYTGYKAVPFLPESNESMVARFALALCPLPRLPTRQHTFDFENNVRMIASEETKPGVGAIVHISFGIMPNSNIKADFDLRAFALQAAGKFITLPEIFSAPQTGKLFHLFYKA